MIGILILLLEILFVLAVGSFVFMAIGGFVISIIDFFNVKDKSKYEDTF